MAHVRKQIRDAVVVALTGLAATGTNVFPSRFHRVPQSKIPALLIYTNDETAVVENMGGVRPQHRDLDVVVEIMAEAVADVEDQVDQILAEVEAALFADITLGGLTRDLTLTRIETRFDGDAEKPLGGAQITVTAEYQTVEGAPETAV